MKKRGELILKMVRSSFLSLAGFEFIFKASTFILFVPLIVQFMNIATDNAGIMYLTTRNIATLMKNPVMLVMLAAILFVFVCIEYYEICCIWSCFRNYTKGIKSDISDLFADGFIHLQKTSRRYGARMFFQIAAVTPLLCFHMMVILFHRLDILENCVKYIFGGMPVKFIGIITSAACVFLFSLATQRFGKSISGDSGGIKHFFRRTFQLFILNLITGIFLVLLYLLLIFLSAVVIRFTGNQSTALVYLIRTENVIYYILAFIAAALGVVTNTALVFVFHKKEHIKEVKPEKKVKGIKRKMITVLLLIVFCADVSRVAGYAVNGSHILEDIFISTEVTAHRGGAKFVPENTMYGVEYAIESGADYIEIDVQMSSDGVVFLLHDDNLKRTTGYNRLAYTMTYDEISKLDAGSYFDSEFSDAYIPTLDEVLSACKSRINLNIEIKKSRNGNEVIRKVIALIKEHEMLEQCVLTSTEYSYLKIIKETEPAVRTGFISNMLYGEAASLEYADFFSVKYVVVSENFVKSAHKAGKEVHVWTVNTKPLINRMKGLDVDCIITDNPVLVRKIMSRKNDRKSFAEILQTFLFSSNK